jgi:hypothetical protein
MRKAWLVLLLVVATPLFATTYYCPERTANVVYVTADGWSTSLLATSENPATVPISDSCPIAPASVHPRGGVFIPNWPDYLCNKQASIGVTRLVITEGSCVSLSTEAVFRDGAAVVEIPELPDALPAKGEGVLRFRKVRSGGDVSTFIALISAEGGETRAVLTYYGADGSELGSSFVSVSTPFAWVEVPVEMSIGSIEVANIGAGVGVGAPDAGLYAIAFTGKRDGGSPRVITPSVVP